MGNSIEDYRAAIGLFHIRIKGNRRPFKFNFPVTATIYIRKKNNQINNNTKKKWNFRRKLKSWLKLRIVLS
jgi:hypothetical protein